MDQIITAALNSATIGQLAIALQQKLARNMEVKIKPQWIRVQHVSHNDKLLTAADIDHAINCNRL